MINLYSIKANSNRHHGRRMTYRKRYIYNLDNNARAHLPTLCEACSCRIILYRSSGQMRHFALQKTAFCIAICRLSHDKRAPFIMQKTTLGHAIRIIRKTKRFAIPERAVYFLKTKRTAGGTPPPQNIFDRLTPVFT